MAYVQHTPEDVRKMLEVLGLDKTDDLFRSIPAAIRLKRPLSLPPGQTETELMASFQRLADRNRRLDDMPSFLGAGVYHRFVPAAVDYLSGRGEFSTTYTPYQPEVSQGTLQAVFEYQTMVARLTGMDISNASMYEGGTAIAEAVLMAYAVHGKGCRVAVSKSVHPEYRRVLETYLANHPIEIVSVGLTSRGTLDLDALTAAAGDLLGIVVQNPNFFGIVEDGFAIQRAIDALPGQRPLYIVAADPISLGLLAPPGDYGADIVVGDGQSLGNEPSFGGPTFAFFATSRDHVRKIPGRIVGETRDAEGKRGFVLTFQTREQHIRRERATSNICTNQGLSCMRGAMMLVFLGERGIREVAELSTRMAHLARRRLLELPGVKPAHDGPFFQEFVLELPRPAADVYRELLARGVRGGLPLGRYFPDRTGQMMFATTEMTTTDDVEKLVRELASVLGSGPGPDSSTGDPRARNHLESLSR